MECQTAIAVEHCVGEGLNPFAKHGQVASVAQLDLLQNVEMSVDEMRDVRMLLKITSGEFFELIKQRMPFLSSISPRLAAVMAPAIGERDSPAWMNS